MGVSYDEVSLLIRKKCIKCKNSEILKGSAIKFGSWIRGSLMKEFAFEF